MSYVEATQLKKVLHPATCYPLMEKEIPIRVGNTLDFLHPGTLIANMTANGQIHRYLLSLHTPGLLFLLPSRAIGPELPLQLRSPDTWIL